MQQRAGGWNQTGVAAHGSTFYIHEAVTKLKQRHTCVFLDHWKTCYRGKTAQNLKDCT